MASPTRGAPTDWRPLHPTERPDCGGGTGVSQDITVLADLLGHCSVLESMNQDPLVAAGEQSRPEPSRTVPSPQLETPVSNWLR